MDVSWGICAPFSQCRIVLLATRNFRAAADTLPSATPSNYVITALAKRSLEPILRCHFLNQRHSLCGYLWFRSSCPGFVLPIQLKSLAVPARDPSRVGQ